MSVTHARGAGLSASGEDPRALIAGDNWKERLSEALSLFGAATDIDRVYVFENRRGPDGRLWMDMAAEWTAEGVPSQLTRPDVRLHPYYPAFQRWIDVLGAGQEICGRVADLPELERAVFTHEGSRWTWQVPILTAGGWWGFIGMDVVRDEVALDDEQGLALRGVATALSESIDRERVQQEASMRDDLYRTMVERGPLINYIDAPDEGASSVYVSPQIEQLVGYTVDEWQGDPDLWSRILHPDDRARALAENARHNETGEPFRLEYRMVHRNGSIVWVYDEARVERDDAGKVVYSHGVMLDITARKRARRAGRVPHVPRRTDGPAVP